MRLTLQILKISIKTNKGDFGKEIEFDENLNIVRAKNSKGKSTILNSILYGLGVEEILGYKNSNSMKSALNNKLEYEGNLLEVENSKVELQLKNEDNEVITTERWIVSKDKKEELVRVYKGGKLSSKEELDYEDYYVHLNGAAVNSKGFHNYLVNFIGWNLPMVPTFKNIDRPLYIQTIFPVFFIEQLKGWLGFYPPLKSNFQIRDLPKKVFEFILNLDVLENNKKRIKLQEDLVKLNSEWKELRKEVQQELLEINVTTINLPTKPKLDLKLDISFINSDKVSETIPQRIYRLETELKEIRNSVNVSIRKKDEELEKKLEDNKKKLLGLDLKVKTIEQKIKLEENNLSVLESNLLILKEDLEKNKEIRKLYKLGSDLELVDEQHLCPICENPMHDTLLITDKEYRGLDLNQNIILLENQIRTVEFGINESRKIIIIFENEFKQINQLSRKIRKENRLLNNDLVGEPNTLSEASIEELIEKKLNLTKLLRFEKKWLLIKSWYEEYCEKYKLYEEEVAMLPNEYFSELDYKKIEAFEKYIKSLMKKFKHLEDANLKDLTISLDKYIPTIEGVDLSFDASASDNIRLIWSYFVALLKTSNQYNGNHIKLIVFDEPGQHQTNIESQKNLFKELKSMNNQSIIGTSLEKETVTIINKGINAKIIELGDEYIIQPI